jgi:hypothetical protein
MEQIASSRAPNDICLPRHSVEAVNSALCDIIDLCRVAQLVIQGDPKAFPDTPEHRDIRSVLKAVAATADAANLKLIEVIE